ncbi:hypothetical protein BV898_14336 [Hypsibius exemplaris]|uniref:Uncharacterized protein n=1 Tax=Hypsibius exemplaris TaxID=2072580 RepID=A0A9X6NBP1_HYPEX|nr:hypothetical protein BV898_14336 [Hypsibius exemplaris]
MLDVVLTVDFRSGFDEADRSFSTGANAGYKHNALGVKNVTSAQDFVRLICRRLHFECNFVVQYFGLGLSTSSFYVFQETFGDNTTNTIGVARIAMTMDWMREIDFIYPSASVHYVIAVCEKNLGSGGDGAFFIALSAGAHVIVAFIVIALIFVVLAGLITFSEVVMKQFSASSSMSSGISALTHSLFRLYTIAFGQGICR